MEFCTLHKSLKSAVTSAQQQCQGAYACPSAPVLHLSTRLELLAFVCLCSFTYGVLHLTHSSEISSHFCTTTKPRNLCVPFSTSAASVDQAGTWGFVCQCGYTYEVLRCGHSSETSSHFCTACTCSLVLLLCTTDC